MAQITFNQLLKAAGSGDTENLKEQAEELESRRQELEEELEAVRAELREAQEEILKPVRAAVRAARELGIEVPEEYQELRVNTGTSPKSQGSYEWQVEGLKPAQLPVARACWRYTRGCGGSVGKNGEGIFSSEEFWNFVREKTGQTEDSMNPGDTLELELPNGKRLTFTKLEA